MARIRKFLGQLRLVEFAVMEKGAASAIRSKCGAERRKIVNRKHGDCRSAQPEFVNRIVISEFSFTSLWIRRINLDLQFQIVLIRGDDHVGDQFTRLVAGDDTDGVTLACLAGAFAGAA